MPDNDPQIAALRIVKSSTPKDDVAALDVSAFVHRQHRAAQVNANRSPNAKPSQDSARESYGATDAKVATQISQVMFDELLERLELVRLMPDSVLCLGFPVGDYCHRLAARYPKATVTEGRLMDRPRQSVWRRWQQRRIKSSRFDPLQRWPLPDQSVDLICCAWFLAWYPLAPLLDEMRRLLRPGGLLIVNMPGTDTLAELRDVAPGVVHHFPDVQDVGAALQTAGFVDTVVDVDRLRLAVPNAESVSHWLSTNGWSNVRADRPRGLMGRQRWQARQQALAQRLILQNENPGISLEAVYGHAWAPAANQRGRVAVDFPGN